MVKRRPQKTENKRTAEVAELPKPPPVQAWYEKYQQCWHCKKYDSAGAIAPGTDKWYCQPCWVWYNAWVLQSQAVAAAVPVPEPMDVDSDGL